jgi:hypothetical protein
MDYKKTKIYKIWSTQGKKIYIGSTTKDYLSQRMTAHRNKYYQYKKNKRGSCITSYLLFDEYGLENCFIELIEAKECTNKDEKNQLEGHYIRTLKCVNKNIQGRTPKEYRKENDDKIKEYKKEYKNNNKDKIKVYNKEYRKKNYDKIKEEDKKYRKENDDKIKEYQKKYNKEYIKIKIICECGSEICKSNKTHHIKTKKHIFFLENK